MNGLVPTIGATYPLIDLLYLDLNNFQYSNLYIHYVKIINH